MNDNKLGLAIAGADRGYRIIEKINEGQWIDNVRDIREDLKLIPNRRIGDSILMLTCIDSGFLLIIASPIWGRGTDYISAWIYIPDNLQISGTELKEIVIKQATDEILADRIDFDKLKDIFNTTYNINRITHNLRPTDGSEQQYACRYYGNGSGSNWSLKELLHPDRLYQPYYQDYKCIFFIDKPTGLTCADSVKDITSDDVLKSVYMDEPQPVHGFEPYIDGKKFNSARYFTEGERVPIEWIRVGYKSITTYTDIQKDTKEWNFPQENQYERLIPYEMFPITDQLKQPINNYHLYINHKEIHKGEKTHISESDLRNVCVSVEANGYNKNECTYDLTPTDSIQIKLEKIKYTYPLEIKARNGEYYKIEITSIQDKLNESPIEGYVSQGGYPIEPEKSTMLVPYSPFDKTFWIRTAIILSTVFIVGIGLGGVLYWKFITPIQEEANRAKNKYSTTANTPTATTTANDNAVIQYLDERGEWGKDELEKFTETKGLFDALTAHQFDKISSYKDKIKGSKRFEDIMKRVTSITEKGQEDNYTDNYKEDKDSIITVEKYIQHLNQQESTASKDKQKK